LKRKKWKKKKKIPGIQRNQGGEVTRLKPPGRKMARVQMKEGRSDRGGVGVRLGGRGSRNVRRKRLICGIKAMRCVEKGGGKNTIGDEKGDCFFHCGIEVLYCTKEKN